MIVVFLFFINALISTPHTEGGHFFEEKAKVESAKATETAKKLDISGYWEGTITRDEGGGKRVVFQMELSIEQKGKEFTGISHVHLEDNGRHYAAKMSLEGKVSGTYVNYVEKKILSHDPLVNAEWCIKKVDLLVKTDQYNQPSLEGIWEGRTSLGSCTPGRVFLHRRPPRV